MSLVSTMMACVGVSLAAIAVIYGFGGMAEIVHSRHIRKLIPAEIVLAVGRALIGIAALGIVIVYTVEHSGLVVIPVGVTLIIGLMFMVRSTTQYNIGTGRLDGITAAFFTMVISVWIVTMFLVVTPPEVITIESNRYELLPTNGSLDDDGVAYEQRFLSDDGTEQEDLRSYLVRCEINGREETLAATPDRVVWLTSTNEAPYVTVDKNVLGVVDPLTGQPVPGSVEEEYNTVSELALHHSDVTIQEVTGWSGDDIQGRSMTHSRSSSSPW